MLRFNAFLKEEPYLESEKTKAHLPPAYLPPLCHRRHPSRVRSAPSSPVVSPFRVRKRRLSCPMALPTAPAPGLVASLSFTPLSALASLPLPSPSPSPSHLPSPPSSTLPLPPTPSPPTPSPPPSPTSTLSAPASSSLPSPSPPAQSNPRSFDKAYRRANLDNIRLCTELRQMRKKIAELEEQVMIFSSRTEPDTEATTTSAATVTTNTLWQPVLVTGSAATPYSSTPPPPPPPFSSPTVRPGFNPGSASFIPRSRGYCFVTNPLRQPVLVTGSAAPPPPPPPPPPFSPPTVRPGLNPGSAPFIPRSMR